MTICPLITNCHILNAPPKKRFLSQSRQCVHNCKQLGGMTTCHIYYAKKIGLSKHTLEPSHYTAILVFTLTFDRGHHREL